MKEYRRIIDTPVVLLRLDDIKKLMKILITDIPEHSHAFEFSIHHDNMQIRADNVDDLFAQDLPNKIDGLTCTIRGWNDNNEIDRGITLSFHSRVSDYQIHAYDETWFLGKIEQINSFLENKKPWYSYLSKHFATLNGVLSGIFLIIFIFLNIQEKFLYSLAPLIITIMLHLSFKNYQNGELFPKTKIIIKEEELTQINYQLWSLAVGILSFFATIVGLFK